MKTIAEIEEDPLEFVSWAKATFAEEHGYDLQRMVTALLAGEEAARARGIKFVDFSNQYSHASPGGMTVREDPPSSTAS